MRRPKSWRASARYPTFDYYKKSQRFAAQGGRCWHCNGPMAFQPHQASLRRAVAPDEATWEHLDDRFSPERGKRGGELRRVLAHATCNHERGQQRQVEMIEEQRRKSEAGHRRRA